MKLKSPTFATLAAISYGLFALFGIAVWHTLLFVALPKGTTPLDTLQGLLELEPGAQLLRFHAATTLAAAAFASVLMLKPPTRTATCLVAAIASVLLAALVWTVFAPDVALLPTMAAVALVWGWFNASRTAPSDA
jgi:hypothetical protein